MVCGEVRLQKFEGGSLRDREAQDVAEQGDGERRLVAEELRQRLVFRGGHEAPLCGCRAIRRRSVFQGKEGAVLGGGWRKVAKRVAEE
jgi:hypothetical protein